MTRVIRENELRNEKSDVKNESSFEIVIQRGVISDFTGLHRMTGRKVRFLTHSTESQKSNIAIVDVFCEDRPWVIWRFRPQICQ